MQINLKNIIIIIFFLLLQVIWFNHILVFGNYSPIIFIFPILLFPIHKQESLSIIISFLMGLSIDIFVNTGGVFAATALIVVFFRKLFFLFTKSQSQDIKNLSPELLNLPIKTVYYFSFILMSQFLIFSLESFNLSFVLRKIPIILGNTALRLVFFLFIDLIFLRNNTE